MRLLYCSITDGKSYIEFSLIHKFALEDRVICVLVSGTGINPWCMCVCGGDEIDTLC